MALSGKTLPPRMSLFLNWPTAYAYALLCTGCFGAYLGVSPTLLFVIAALLALPSVAKQRTSPAEICLQVVLALIFAVLAHIVGRGIAGVVGA